MASLKTSSTNSMDYTGYPSNFCEVLWYAVYTKANHEKRVADHFARRSVEHFLPLYESVRRWKDRKVQLQFPLFPGYVFVRLTLHDRVQVLQVPGVARLVGFNGKPAALREGEIEALRTSLASGVRAKPHAYLTAGQRVRVKSGPMVGLEGTLLKRKNRAWFVVSVELIQRAIAVELEDADLEPVIHIS